MQKDLALELEFLKKHQIKGLIISTTAKEAIDFTILPRRVYENIGISSFMINDIQKLNEVLTYYDGVIDYFYIDVELKQQINLYKTAQEVVKKTKIIAIKPNDTTLESLDVLIREKYADNLIGKKILVIGSGNLASKIMIRLAERQADVFVIARSDNKAEKIISGINMFLSKNTDSIKRLKSSDDICFDVVVGAISNKFKEEAILKKVINKETFFIDAGINNFRTDFIKELLKKGNDLLRLDTRIALPYQMIIQNNYTNSFFSEVIGKRKIKDIVIVAGGIVGGEGAVIVDRIERPTQIIGIADGSGGVKKSESGRERNRIETIQQYISETS